ncbi:hypothetical protein SAY87_007700 [Trapa incisa]|uniref:Uncharacterized protein n=1 Tax=Trapa incisa TaxID=236973 RepID=A0AAN7KJS3_9MYRT|nr:hypothetical protein SAY87_007700 [Trapa incisa]
MGKYTGLVISVRQILDSCWCYYGLWGANYYIVHLMNLFELFIYSVLQLITCVARTSMMKNNPVHMIFQFPRKTIFISLRHNFELDMKSQHNSFGLCKHRLCCMLLILTGPRMDLLNIIMSSEKAATGSSPSAICCNAPLHPENQSYRR